MICLLAVLHFLDRIFGFLIREDSSPVVRRAIFFLGRLLIGFCTALIFWYLLINATLGGTLTSRILLYFLVVIFCLGCLVVRSIRCVFLLISLQFFGKAGRSAMKTLLFGVIITGPLTNLAKNALEINRVFLCSSELAYNLSKTHIDLMIFPFRAAIEELQNVSQVRESFRIVDDVVDAIVREVEQEDDPEELLGSSPNPPIARDNPAAITENYSKKLSRRCLDQIESGRDECASVFSSLYDACKETIPDLVAGQFCWMMDIESLCFSKMNNKTEELCTPRNVLNDSFGETYLELLMGRKEFMEEIEGVEISYSFNESDFVEKIEKMDINQDELGGILEEKILILNKLLGLMKILIAFTYIKIIIRSSFYLSSFLMELDFENIYITSAFREIDQERLELGERTVLPLKKLERTSLVENPFEKRRIKNDYRDLIYHLLKFLLQLMAVTVFILLDWLLVTALEVVAEKGKMDFTQKGEVEVNVTVSGEGMMASVVGSIISGFQVNRTVEDVTDNEECLPVPSKLSTVWFLKIYGIFLGILLMIYNESYTKRLLFLICAFFYPKRQHERSFFLYNRILLSRRDFFRHMKATLKRDAQEDEGGFIFKKLCKLWRRIFPPTRHCIICQEAEKKLKSSLGQYQELRPEFVKCSAEACLAVYCDECWSDLEGICVLCS